jgi:hypothetical protein
MTPFLLRAVGLVVGAGVVGASCSAVGGWETPAAGREILYTSQAPGGTEDIRILHPE